MGDISRQITVVLFNVPDTAVTFGLTFKNVDIDKCKALDVFVYDKII